MNARRTLSVKPEIEALEDRLVPTTATFSSGVLRVFGTDAAETIRLTQNATQIVVEGVGYVNAASVQSIVVDAKGGDDTVDCRTLKIGASIYGGLGNDFLVGTAAGDTIFSGAGNDRVFGMDGNDA